MTRIETSVDFDAPVTDVFAFVSDWRHWRDCWVGVSDLKPATGITRGNGARFTYKACIAMVSLNLETEIHDFEQDVGWRGVVTSVFPHGSRWVLEPLNGKTRLTCILEYDPDELFLGSLADRLLLRPMWRRRVKKSLGNMKIGFERQQGSRHAKSDAAGT